MSHVVDIKAEIKDLDALERGARRLGGTLRRGQRSYKWYGVSMGDYPLPEGTTAGDMGKCDHAIGFPQESTYYGYEIGVVSKGDGTFKLRWDFFDTKLMQAVGGEQAPRLIQAYAVEKAKIEARRRGQAATERVREDGTIELVINAR